MKITRDHIIQYLRGELPHHEQYMLEKLMLEDPFLSDAVEGLQEIEDPEKISDALNEIEDLIIENYGKVKTVSLPIYRNPVAIAATVSLIVLSAAILLIVPDYKEKLQSLLIKGKNEPSEQIEQATQEEAEGKDQGLMLDEDSLAGIALDTNSANPPPSEVQSNEPVQENPEDADADELLAAEEESEGLQAQISEVDEDIAFAEDETDIPQEIPDLARDTLQDFISETQISEVSGVPGQGETQPVETLRGRESPSEQAAKRTMAAPETERQVSDLSIISGQVISAADNQPLSGVNVLIKGTSKGVITDNTGSFEMKMPADPLDLEFYYIGFQPADLNVEAPGSYDVTLQSSGNQFSQFIILNDGNEAGRIEGSDRFASPQLARTEYIRYLQDNVLYPEAASENNVRGQVVVEFTVTIDGSISNIMVVRSLGFGCDDEVIRLITEGPSWQPGIRNGAVVPETVRVSVFFSP